MPRLQFEGQDYVCADNETVLDCLTAQGASIPSSCRSGTCQTCLMQSREGMPPAAAQAGLKDTLKAQGYFMACVCHPQEDMVLALPDSDVGRQQAVVRQITPLSPDILCVALESSTPMNYRPGQFITLFKDKTLGRSYSLASVPDSDPFMHLHVRRMPGGRLSEWIHQDLQPGQALEIGQPAGDCFYMPNAPEQPLLLIGTGSGLAPLYGIVRDALRQEHRGPIHLFHGSRERTGLYLTDALQDLAARHSNFRYTPCLSGEDAGGEYARGRALDIALSEYSNLKSWRIYLCGHPEMVRGARRRAFLAGAAMQDIYADAFTRAA